MDELLASIGRIAETDPSAAIPILLLIGVGWAIRTEKRMSKPEAKDEKINLIRSIDSKIDILLDRIKR